MEFSFSGANDYDTEDSFSEDSLNPTFSGGYVPCGDTISCEDTTFQEEITFNVDFSVQWLLTNERRGGVENASTPLSRQDQIEGNPEPGFRQSRALPWDDHEDTIASEDYIVQGLLSNLHNYLQILNDDEESQGDDSENQVDGNENRRDDSENKKAEQIQENDKADDSAFPEPSEEHDVQLCPRVAQRSHREHGPCLDSPKSKPLESKGAIQFPEILLMLKGQNLTKQVVSQAMGNRKASSTETCSSVPQEGEDPSSNTQSTACVNFRRAFHWARKQVCCCRRRRRNSKQSTQRPCRWAPARKGPVRGKMRQQEESFE